MKIERREFTVKQLIECLSSFDQNALVVVDGYEGGVDSKITIESGKAALDRHCESYYGDHQMIDKYHKEETGDKVVGVVYLARG